MDSRIGLIIDSVSMSLPDMNNILVSKLNAQMFAYQGFGILFQQPDQLHPE